VLPATPKARELTPDEAELRASAMYALDQEIKKGLRSGREAMWKVAQALHEFDEGSGWTALGYEKLSDWLAEPDIGMMRRTYYRLVSSYRELVVLRRVDESKLLELDVSKVDIVLPAVKSGKVDLEDALEDVKELGARDLRDKYISRPDPADSATTTDDIAGANVGTGMDPDVAAHTTVIVNPTDDTPKRASDVDLEDDPDVEDVEEAEVVEEGQVEPAHNPTITGMGQLPPAVAKAIEDAETALELPQRLAGTRQAVRSTLERLIAAIREATGE
jgi:hypothetical protein